MRLVLNSDVLYHRGRLVRDELQQSMPELFGACRERGHEIVIPLTTELEFLRHQREERDRERAAVRNALRLFDGYGLAHDDVDLDALVTEPDLLALVRATGVTAVSLPPTLEQFNEAHRRATLHEPPHPPDAKSDEMRDLIIWTQAIDISRADGGAVLLSRDELHLHPRGDDEANSVGLVRLRDVPSVLDYFQVRSPAAVAVADLVTTTWPALVTAAPDLPEIGTVKRINAITFRQGERGLEAAQADVELDTANGPLSAHVLFEIRGGVVTTARLYEVTVDGAPHEVVEAHTAVPAPQFDRPSEAALDRLREVLNS